MRALPRARHSLRGLVERLVAWPLEEGDDRVASERASTGQGRGEWLTLALVTALLGLGLLASSFVIGAVWLLVVGELFPLPPDRSASWRGRALFASFGVLGGLTVWLPWAEAALARGVLLLAIVSFAHVPVHLTDPSTTLDTALARSVDRLLRARPRDLVPALTVAAFFTLAPHVMELVWQFDRAGRPLVETIGSVALCALVAVGAAAPTVIAVRALARSSRDDERHRAPLSRLGVAVAAMAILGALWTIGTLPVVARSGGGLVVSYPYDVSRVGDGGAVWMRRSDGAEFGVLLHHERENWWIDAIDAGSIDVPTADTRFAHATSVADERVAAMHILGMLGLAPLVLGLAWFVWARGGSLRDRLRRSHVTRARFRASDLEGATAISGAELVLGDGTRVRLAAAMPVEGLAATSRVGEWIEGAVIAPRAWAPGGGYRSTPQPPPSGARLLAGDVADAIVVARLDDTRRALWLGAACAPMLLLVVGLLSSLE